MRQRLQLRPRVAIRFNTALVFTFASVVLVTWAVTTFNLTTSNEAIASDRAVVPSLRSSRPAPQVSASSVSATTPSTGLNKLASSNSPRYNQMRQSEFDARSESFRAVVGTPSQGHGQLSVLRTTMNPAGRTVQVPVNVSQSGTAVLRIFSSTGYCMSSREVNLAAGDNQITCEAANLPTGAYQVVLDIQGDIRTGRFTKNW